MSGVQAAEAVAPCKSRGGGGAARHRRCAVQEPWRKSPSRRVHRARAAGGTATARRRCRVSRGPSLQARDSGETTEVRQGHRTTRFALHRSARRMAASCREGRYGQEPGGERPWLVVAIAPQERRRRNGHGPSSPTRRAKSTGGTATAYEGVRVGREPRGGDGRDAGHRGRRTAQELGGGVTVAVAPRRAAQEPLSGL